MMNPGATGVYDFVDVTLGGRMQWLGFDNAPKTSYLYFAAPVSALKNAKMKRTYGVIRRGRTCRWRLLDGGSVWPVSAV